MIKAIVITAAGEVRTDSPSSLEDYQKLVGGWVERISLPLPGGRDPASMLVNEEGRSKGLPVNDIATRLMMACWGEAVGPILGDVVIVSTTASDFADAPAWVAEWLAKHAGAPV